MVHFYKESSSETHVKWSAILDKPQLVESIESAENKLIINYEDGTIEEIEVSTTGSGGGNHITNVTQVENANIIGVSCNSKENSLQALYDFDQYDGGSFLKDVSPSQNHSTIFKQAPVFERDDELGRQVAVFNGAQYISFGKTPKFPMTSVFVMAYSNDWENIVGNTIISCTETGGYSMTIDKSGNFTAQVYVGGSYKKVTWNETTGISLSSGWHVFAFVFDGYYLIAYIDKKEIGRIAVSTDLIKSSISYHSSNSILLGAEAYSGNTPASSPAYFTGKIAEVRIYNKGLTKEELFEVYDEIINHKPVIYDVPITITGDYIQKVEINELSNPLTMKPLAYGWFKLSMDQTVDKLSIIPFDTIKDGNIETPKDGIFKLRQGITYEVCLEMYATSSSNGSIRFECYNIETNEVLITCGKVPTSNNAHMISSSLKGFITPIENIQVGFRPSVALSTVYFEHSYVMIQEVRNNPVNQYGGFQTNVLFDGEANEVGEYELTDNVNKYDFLILEKTSDTNIELVPKMTSNISPGPYVAFASNEFDSRYAAWKAFEKKNSVNTDSWLTQSLSGNDFIGIDFGVPTGVTSFSLTCPTGYASGASTSPPKSFILQGSIDNNQWVDIKEIKNQINWSEKETRIYLLDGLFRFRYYRLFLTEKNHSTNQYGIGEIQFYKSVGKALNDVMLIPTNYNSFANDKISIELNENRIRLNQVDSITRIIGIRGQLPSLLIGGTF